MTGKDMKTTDMTLGNPLRGQQRDAAGFSNRIQSDEYST